MNKLMKILPVVMVVCMVLTSVFAIDVPTNDQLVGNQTGSNTVTEAAQNIWATVVTIVQILAFAAVVFAGLRYMFASADQKADIKKSLGILTVGAILVFAASTVVKFVVGIGGDLLKIQ